MPSFVPNRKGIGAAGILAAIVATGLFSARLARHQASPTPFELFQTMLPVIRHPRCANCHGGVDPFSGRAHTGGRIDTVSAHKGSEQCADCHQKGWDIPSADHFVVGKTDREVCAVWAEFAMKQGHARFIDNHLKHDDLIIAGFEGEAGGPLSPPAKPTMKQVEFVKLGQDWIDKGQGACELLGTIVLRESVSARDSFSLGPLEIRQSYSGARTVTINVRDGKYYADIKTDYTVLDTSMQTLADPKTGQPCHIISIRNEHQSGSTADVASVRIKDTVFFGDTDPPQTDYRIDVTLPAETTTKNETSRVEDGCNTGLPFPPSSTTRSYTWGRMWFVIEGHVEDPKTDGRAGGCERISKSTEINTFILENDRKRMPCFRFKNMGNSWYLGLMRRTIPKTFHDETPVPFHFNASWNLKYAKQ